MNGVYLAKPHDPDRVVRHRTFLGLLWSYGRLDRWHVKIG